MLYPRKPPLLATQGYYVIPRKPPLSTTEGYYVILQEATLLVPAGCYVIPQEATPVRHKGVLYYTPGSHPYQPQRGIMLYPRKPPLLAYTPGSHPYQPQSGIISYSLCSMFILQEATPISHRWGMHFVYTPGSHPYQPQVGYAFCLYSRKPSLSATEGYYVKPQDATPISHRGVCSMLYPRKPPLSATEVYYVIPQDASPISHRSWMHYVIPQDATPLSATKVYYVIPQDATTISHRGVLFYTPGCLPYQPQRLNALCYTPGCLLLNAAGETDFIVVSLADTMFWLITSLSVHTRLTILQKIDSTHLSWST